MIFSAQNSLIQMCNAPSLGNVEIKYRDQLLAGFGCLCISPGTERHQKFSGCIERHIAVHHSAESQRAQGGQLLTVFCLYIVCQALVASLQAFPDIFQAVGPDVVLQTVLPVVGSHGDGCVALIYQYRFDSGGTKLNTEGCFSCSDRFFYCFVHCVLSFSLLYLSHFLFPFSVHFSCPRSAVTMSPLLFSPDSPWGAAGK